MDNRRRRLPKPQIGKLQGTQVREDTYSYTKSVNTSNKRLHDRRDLVSADITLLFIDFVETSLETL